MPKSIDAMTETMIANMKEKTGKTLEQWLKIVDKTKTDKHMELVKFLKVEHAVTHGFANMIAHYALNPVAADDDSSLVDRQYAGNKAALRPLYDALVKDIQEFWK